MNMNMNNQGNNQGNNAGNVKEDYVDKTVDAVEKKTGQATGHPVDPQKFRNQNEKATDMARDKFEHMTGKKVPEKFSN